MPCVECRHGLALIRGLQIAARFVSKVEDIEKDEPMAKKATAKKPLPKSKPVAKAAKGKR